MRAQLIDLDQTLEAGLAEVNPRITRLGGVLDRGREILSRVLHPELEGEFTRTYHDDGCRVDLEDEEWQGHDGMEGCQERDQEEEGEEGEGGAGGNESEVDENEGIFALRGIAPNCTDGQTPEAYLAKIRGGDLDLDLDLNDEEQDDDGEDEEDEE